MPTYKHTPCPNDGNEHSTAKIAETQEVWEAGCYKMSTVQCEVCNICTCRIVPNGFPATVNMTPISVGQVGRSFSSYKHAEAYARANGYDIADGGGGTGSDGQRVRDGAREDAETMFRDMGFRDKEDFNRQHKRDPSLKHEMAAQAAQRSTQPPG